MKSLQEEQLRESSNNVLQFKNVHQFAKSSNVLQLNANHHQKEQSSDYQLRKKKKSLSKYCHKDAE